MILISTQDVDERKFGVNPDIGLSAHDCDCDPELIDGHKGVVRLRQQFTLMLSGVEGLA